MATLWARNFEKALQQLSMFLFLWLIYALLSTDSCINNIGPQLSLERFLSFSGSGPEWYSTTKIKLCIDVGARILTASPKLISYSSWSHQSARALAALAHFLSVTESVVIPSSIDAIGWRCSISRRAKILALDGCTSLIMDTLRPRSPSTRYTFSDYHGLGQVHRSVPEAVLQECDRSTTAMLKSIPGNIRNGIVTVD